VTDEEHEFVPTLSAADAERNFLESMGIKPTGKPYEDLAAAAKELGMETKFERLYWREDNPHEARRVLYEEGSKKLGFDAVWSRAGKRVTPGQTKPVAFSGPPLPEAKTTEEAARNTVEMLRRMGIDPRKAMGGW